MYNYEPLSKVRHIRARTRMRRYTYMYVLFGSLYGIEAIVKWYDITTSGIQCDTQGLTSKMTSYYRY